MKCPVCKTNIDDSLTACPNCKFSDLHRTFINSEDAATWFENVVVPYRIEWEKKSQPVLMTADELYAQMASKQNKNISSHINESVGDFEYADYKDGIELTRYIGNSSSVNVPEKIDGKQVLKFGNSLFKNCKWITTVTLPNGLTTIGYYAFKNTQLTHIALPDSIKEIEGGAFADSAITEITLPDSIVVVDDDAFARSAITEIIFPPSIEIISEGVCSHCYKLKTVVIMAAIEIERYAFAFCDSLTKLVLPETLTTIKESIFTGCDALKEVILPASVESVYEDFYCSHSGRIVVLNDDMIWRSLHYSYESYTSVKDITIYCNPGSTSQQHAWGCGIKMKLLSEYPH